MKKQILPLAFVCATSSLADADVITTLFASDNGGGEGGAVYFDLQVAGNNLTITEMTSNFAENVGTSFSDFQVYTRVLGPGEGSGDFAGSPTGWNLVSTGSGVVEPEDTPTPITLGSPIPLSSGTDYGIALVSPSVAGHEYTDGDGTNQLYSDSNLSLELGSATNTAFVTPTLFSPRVWNGSITYSVTPIPEPTNALTLSFLLLGGVMFRGRRRSA